MPKVKFLRPVEVRDHNKKVEAAYKEGETKDLSVESAARWVRRGIAEYVTDKSNAEPEKAVSKFRKGKKG